MNRLLNNPPLLLTPIRSLALHCLNGHFVGLPTQQSNVVGQKGPNIWAFFNGKINEPCGLVGGLCL